MISHQELFQVAEAILGSDVDVETVELDSIQQIEFRARLQQQYPSIGETLSEVPQFADVKDLAVKMKARGILG